VRDRTAQTADVGSRMSTTLQPRRLLQSIMDVVSPMVEVFALSGSNARPYRSNLRDVRASDHRKFVLGLRTNQIFTRLLRPTSKPAETMNPNGKSRL
jgi:hypothetical protein